MNLGQRVVLSVAIGSALAVTADTVIGLLTDEVDGGWFMYAPEGNSFISSGVSDGGSLSAPAVWLAAITMWFGISWRLFRARTD